MEPEFEFGTSAIAFVLLAGLAGLGACAILAKRLPPHRPGRLREGLPLFAASFLVFHLLLTMIRMLAGPAGEKEVSIIFPWNLYLAAASLGLVILGAVGFVARYRGREGLGALGFEGKRPWILAGFTLSSYVAFLPLYILVCALVNNLIMPYEPQEIVKDMLDNPEHFRNLAVISCTMLLIPLFEEVLFRGFLLSGLRSFMNDRAAVLLTAIAFGALHELQAMIPVFALGCILGALRVRTESLLSPMLLHALHNSLMLLMIPLF